MSILVNETNTTEPSGERAPATPPSTTTAAPTPAPTAVPPCRWPVTNWPACDRCSQATLYFDAATASCKSCGASSARMFHVVPHGQTATVPYALANAQCSSGRSVSYYGGSTANRWTRTVTPLTSSGFSVRQYCGASSNLYSPVMNSMLLVATGSSYSSSYLGSLICVQPVTLAPQTRRSTDALAPVHLHVIGKTAADASTFVSTVGALVGRGHSVTASFGFATGVEAVASVGVAASLMNAALSTGVATGSGASCQLFDSASRTLAAAVPATAGSVVVIGSATTGCTAVFNDLAAVVRAGKRLAWIAVAPPELRFVTPIATPQNSFATALAAGLSAFVVPPTADATTCVSGIALPTSVEAWSRDLIPVAGACNVSSCCVAGQCSRFADNAGTPSCAAPLLVQSAGAKAVTVETDAGRKTGTVTVARSEPWTRGVNAWRQTTWRSFVVDGARQFRNDYAYENVTLWRSRATVECCRWVGVSFGRQVLGAFHGNETFCFDAQSPDNAGIWAYSYFYGYGAYRQMTLPIPQEFADALFSVPVQTIALQCGVVRTADASAADGASQPMTHDTNAQPIAIDTWMYASSSITLTTTGVAVSTGKRGKSRACLQASQQAKANANENSAVHDCDETDGEPAATTTTTAAPATPAPQPPAEAVPLTPINARRVELLITRALELVGDVSTGNAMKHVRLALGAANLHSTLAGEWRVCGAADIPNRNGECRYAWTAKAADAGKHLESAGFTAAPTTWGLSGVQRGDVVVFPAAQVQGQYFGNGAIAIALDSEGNFVSDVVHGRNVFPNLATTLVQGQAIAGDAPVLYRLLGVVEEHPMSRESLMPVPAIAELTNDTETYCRAFNAHDAGARAAYWATAVAFMNEKYRCPAVLDRFTRPREFGGTFDAGINFGDTVQCFEVNVWWIRERPREHGSGVRCCYDAALQYIPRWPSRITFSDANEWYWARTNEGEAERTCCGAGDAATVSSQACLAFRDRRPATLPTNAPFVAPMLWQMRRPWAGGWGDPHCSTYDGFGYECNFHGEAVWSACASTNWTVHAAAEPVGTGRATAITKFAIDANGTSVIGRLTAEQTDAGTYWQVLVGEEDTLGSDFRSDAVTVSVSNNTVTIVDANGNEVEAVFSRSLIRLATAPTESCRGAATGLCGNFNGNASDDLAGANGALVSVNASSEAIYEAFVLEQLVTDGTASLFPADMGVVSNASYRPAFITADVLSNCPAACNGDRGCCFDASVGGEEFQREFTTAKAALTADNLQTVGLNENVPPVFEQGTPVYEYSGSAGGSAAASVTLGTYVAVDSDTVAALTCTICTATGVACATAGLGSARATLTVTGPAPTESGAFQCTATDALGAVGRAATSVLAAGETSGIGFVTNAPTPAPTLVAPTPANNAGSSPTAAAGDSSAARDRNMALIGIGIGIGVVVIVAVVIGVSVFLLKRRPTQTANTGKADDSRKRQSFNVGPPTASPAREPYEEADVEEDDFEDV